MPLATLPIGPFPHLSAPERGESLRETLARAPRAEAIWVFAYGSLVWRPCFAASGRQWARLPGYERRFSVYTVEARGTPERPGLGLGLEPGEAGCEGVLLRVPDEARDEALAALWAREMLTGVYRPCWLETETRADPLVALAFVIEHAHPQHAGALTEAEQAMLIAAAAGRLGPCREYLARTVQSLAEAGIEDPGLVGLLERVRAR